MWQHLSYNLCGTPSAATCLNRPEKFPFIETNT